MTGRERLPDEHVPDVVLEELLAAFGTPSGGDAGDTGDVSYDFDDPSIDRLLGVETEDLRRRANGADGMLGIVEANGSADGRGFVAAGQPPVAEPPPGGLATSPTTRLDAAATTGLSRRSIGRAKRGGDPTVVVPTEPAEPDTPVPAGSGRAKLSRKERKAAKSAAGAATPAVATPTAQGGRRTIVIADDDQHIDPIYLDEDAGHRMREVHGPSSPGPSGRPTIVIDEFDQHTDAVSAVAATSTAIDPRLRARRIAVRRAVGRRRLIWAGIIAAVVLVAVAAVAVLASSLFDVRTIDTQGNVYTDPALITHVQQQLRGKPILLVDTRKLERELETGPWVESARVSTDFPHRALIDIRERIPQATFAGSDGRYRVIDRDGRVLAVLGGRPTAYMLLTGTAPDSEPGQFAGTAYAAAAQLVIALPAEVRAITTSIAVDTTTNEMTLALHAQNATGVTARVGTVSGIEDKLARLLRFVQDGLRPDQHLDVSTVEVGT